VHLLCYVANLVPHIKYQCIIIHYKHYLILQFKTVKFLDTFRMLMGVNFTRIIQILSLCDPIQVKRGKNYLTRIPLANSSKISGHPKLKISGFLRSSHRPAPSSDASPRCSALLFSSADLKPQALANLGGGGAAGAQRAQAHRLMALGKFLARLVQNKPVMPVDGRRQTDQRLQQPLDMRGVV
jgi:hypothetical protein